MRNTVYLSLLIALCIHAGSTNAQTMVAKKILIVYLSRTIERDGVLFVMKGDKAKEAEAEVKAWLKKVLAR